MAAMNVVEVRKAFPQPQILGGLDKTSVMRGSPDVDSELEGKVPGMLKLGTYIPHVDHNVPPDISWNDFVYYRGRLNDMIDAASPEGSWA
jgi:uroporphyrinogen decarboxylase